MNLIIDSRYLKSNLDGYLLIEGIDDGSREDVYSPYRHWVKRDGLLKKDLYYAFLPVPDFWQILAEPMTGAIYDHSKKKATIYFSYPEQRRNVARVEWIDDNGSIYRIDRYDAYGIRYNSDFFGEDGTVESRVYYEDGQRECIIEYPQNEVIVLKQKQIFYSYADFVNYTLDECGDDHVNLCV